MKKSVREQLERVKQDDYIRPVGLALTIPDKRVLRAHLKKQRLKDNYHQRLRYRRNIKAEKAPYIQAKLDKIKANKQKVTIKLMAQLIHITKLLPHQIFVFGSNTSGLHGKGAAKDAKRYFGAIRGQGMGLQGQSYAIPTKDSNLNTLPLKVIKANVDLFLLFAEQHPEYQFIVTPIGTGLAGYEASDIAPMFRYSPTNVVLPWEFLWKLM